MVLITVLTYEAANEYGALEQFPDVDPATVTVTDIMRKIRESTQLHNPHVRVGMRLYTYADYITSDLINDAENDPLALTATLDELRLTGRLQFEEDRRGLHLKVLVDGCRTAEEASEFRLAQLWNMEYEIAALRRERVEAIAAPQQRLPTPRLVPQVSMRAVAAHPTRRADHVRRIWPFLHSDIRIVVMTAVILILAVVGSYYVFVDKSPDQLNNCDRPDYYGLLSPMHQAAMTGQTDKMRALIKQYLTDLPEKTTAKSFADSMKNFVHRAMMLGMNLNEKANDANSLLHLAAKYGRTDTVRVLITEFGANVNERNAEGNTPLHVSSGNGRTETVRALIKEFGADVKAENNHGSTPLHEASMRGQTDTVRALFKECGADLKAKNKDGSTALHEAAKYGRTDTVRVLINELGADVKAENNHGSTPLHMASMHGQTDTVRALVKECGADVSLKTKHGSTALREASHNGDTDTVRVLIKECGADVNEKTKDGYTALQWASLKGHIKTVRVLKELGADVNAKNNAYNTAVHEASWHGQTEIVRMLITEFNADVNVRNIGGWTALGQTPLHHVQTRLLLQSLGAVN